MSLSVLVMAKAPRPGAVKTRLEPLLGPVRCADLQAALIGVAARWAVEAAPGAAYLAYGPDGAGREELEPHVPGGIELFRDGAGDLGDRLAFATQRVFHERSQPLVVVGTDMPLLTPGHAREADEALRDTDVLFGPALDGGYWIVGLHRPCPQLFSLGESWGGPEVLERSLERAREAGLTSTLLGAERDLDDAADARALLGDPRLPARVAEQLSAS